MGNPRSALTPQYWMKVLVSAFAVLLLMVWEHVAVLGMTRQLKNLHKEEDQLIYENARLQTQINQWVSPSHLAKMAHDLKMVPLDSQHVIGVEMHD